MKPEPMDLSDLIKWEIFALDDFITIINVRGYLGFIFGFLLARFLYGGIS
jgi:hypothetical protein